MLLVGTKYDMMKHIFLSFCMYSNVIVLKAQSSCDPLSSDNVANSAYIPGLCGKTFYPEANLTPFSPRGLFVVSSEDDQYYHVLGLERNRVSNEGRVVWYKDDDYDGIAEDSVVLATAPKLSHGLVVDKGYIYASSDTTVYRWPYILDENSNKLMNADEYREIIVKNMNADGQGGAPGGHKTRTLAFDDYGRLYISVGSGANVDKDSTRSRIRRFDLYNTTTNTELEDVIAAGGIDFMTGYVFADGLRNEVGLAFDKYGVLWGVDNGPDELERDDLGGDIHNDNPGEELNRFPTDEEGMHWGYPYCWTEYSLPPNVGGGRGTIWGWPGFSTDDDVTDEWCRENTRPPVIPMQAHSAPLGITFYNYKSDLPSYCPNNKEAFPEEYDGDAFIGFHGSWNRDVPTGYKVVRIPMTDGLPTNSLDDPIDIMWHYDNGIDTKDDGYNAKWPSGLRPADVKFDMCGRLLVSSDGTRRSDYSYYGQTIVTIFASEIEEYDEKVTSGVDASDESSSSSAATTVSSVFCSIFGCN